MPATTRSIGQVLAAIRPEFPDISISKIRYLEAEGLITPVRAPSGYRRYVDGDIDRLRFVLATQRDHYLPLRIIRDHLDKLDRGLNPAPLSGRRDGAAGQESEPAEPPPAPPPVQPQPTARPAVRLSRAELLEASGLSESALGELERTQILHPRSGSAHYGRDALTIAIAARRLAEFGLDSRHLRAFKMSADREVGLVEQAIAPHTRRGGTGREVVGEITQLMISPHAALVRTAMES